MGNIATAFHKKTCPCFSEASYGRNPVEKYSMDVAMRFLLSHKDRLQPRDYEDIIDIFGEKEIDIYNDKVLRSSEGMLFHINIIKRGMSMKYYVIFILIIIDRL